MNQEWVEITAVEPGGVWVEGMQRSACGSCSARAGCGQHTLSKLGRPLTLWVPTEGQWRIGQQVLLSMPAGSLALSALMLYGLPLVSMMVLAVAGRWLSGDGLAAVLGLLGLAGGFLLSHRVAMINRERWQPQIESACAGPLIHSDRMQTES